MLAITYRTKPERKGSLREDDARSCESALLRIKFLVDDVDVQDIGPSRVRILFPARLEHV